MTTFATNTVPFNTNPNIQNCSTPCGYLPVWNGFCWQYVVAGVPNQPMATGYNANTPCAPSYGHPYGNSNAWQNNSTPWNAAQCPTAHPFTQNYGQSFGQNYGWTNTNAWNTACPATSWNNCPTGMFNQPFNYNTFGQHSVGTQPCFPYGMNQNHYAMNTGWNTSPFSFGGNCPTQNCFVPQNCSYPQNTFGYGANWNTFNSYSQPWANQYPANSWCNPFTQNCGTNCCPPSTSCAPFNCAPAYCAPTGPMNSTPVAPFNCQPQSWYPNSFNTFSPSMFGGHSQYSPVNSWYGNSCYTPSYCPTPCNTTPWQGYAPFHPSMTTPWNFSPVGYNAGYPMNYGMPFHPAAYPTAGFHSAAAMNCTPTANRPTENGELGYNLQRNAA